MTSLRVLIARMKGLFANEQQDRELTEELRGHLEMLVEEKRRQGMTEEQARHAAKLQFGAWLKPKKRIAKAAACNSLKHFSRTFVMLCGFCVAHRDSRPWLLFLSRWASAPTRPSLAQLMR